MRTYITMVLLLSTVLATSGQTLWDMRTPYFGGLSLNMTMEGSRSTDVAAALQKVKAQGVTALRIAVNSRDESDFAQLDTLLTIADTLGLRTFVAVADTLIADSASQTPLKRALLHNAPRISAYILLHTRTSDAAMLATFSRWLHSVVPQCQVGLSVAKAEDAVLQQATRGLDYDFFALRLGYAEQQWASPDMVDESMPFVFTRLPQVLGDVCRKTELTDRPLIIDYIDYPRDRGFRFASSSAIVRDNIVNFARGVVAEHAEQVRGMFFGVFAPTCDVEERRHTQTVYVTDTATLRLLTQPMQ